jgi:hypothetical protein
MNKNCTLPPTDAAASQHAEETTRRVAEARGGPTERMLRQKTMLQMNTMTTRIVVTTMKMTMTTLLLQLLPKRLLP